MRWMMAFALLAAVAGAQDAGKEKPKEAPAAPGAGGSIARGNCDAPALSVRIKDQGALEIKAGEAWKAATLADVGERLAKFAEEQDKELKKSGKSAFEQIGGVKVCRLFLSIEVAPTEPWQHVRWLMAVAAEQKYRKLQVSDGKTALLVTLPFDAGVLPVQGNPPTETRVAIHAMARAERAQAWNGVTVSAPTEIRYRCGDSESASLTAVHDELANAMKVAATAPNAHLVGEVKAGNKVPFANMLKLMVMLDGMGVRNVEFAGNASPRPEVRGVSVLPYPTKNYDVN